MNFIKKLFRSNGKLSENVSNKEDLSKEKDIELKMRKIIALKNPSQQLSDFEKLTSDKSANYNLIIKVAEKAFKQNPKEIIIRILFARLIIDSIENKRSNSNYITDKKDIKALEDAVKIHEETQAMSTSELLYGEIMKSCGKAGRMLRWSEDKIDLFIVESAHRKLLGAAYLKILNGDT